MIRSRSGTGTLLHRPSRRFSLLLLSESEQFLNDFACNWTQLPEVGGSTLAGRLKICTESLFLDPDRLDHPVQRFAFTDITSMKLQDNSLLIVPKLARHLKILGKDHPYVVQELSDRTCFQIRLLYSEISAEFSLLEQLHSISSEEHSGTRRKHLDQIVEESRAEISFDTSWFVDWKEKPFFDKAIAVNQISPLLDTPSLFMLTQSHVYVQSMFSDCPIPVLVVPLRSIVRQFKRRHCQQHIAIEFVFLEQSRNHTESSYLFLSFPNMSLRDRIFDEISLIISKTSIATELSFNGTRTSRPIQFYTDQWIQGELCNYDYLMIVNQYAGRSLLDYASYPVFPWVLVDYTSPRIDLSDRRVYRDLSLPMGAVNQIRLKQYLVRFDEMPEPKFHYGTHYSTPGYVAWYLIRTAPQLTLRLQSGRFDQADRLFSSIQEAFLSATTNIADVKELIPQFFDISADPSSSFLINTAGLNLGQKQDGTYVDDVSLPPWSKDAMHFISVMREALDGPIVSSMLHHWIDLIFGYKQRGVNAVNNHNLFYYLTYEGAVDVAAICDDDERLSINAQIREFGQTPTQIFSEGHPAKLSGTSRLASSSVGISASEQSAYQRSSCIPSTEESDCRLSPSDMSDVPIGTARAAAFVSLHRGSSTGLALCPQSHLVLSVSTDSTLKVYDVERQISRRSCAVADPPCSLTAVAVSNDLAFCGTVSNRIICYSISAGSTLDQVMAHDDSITAVIANDLSHLISAGADCAVKVWDIASLEGAVPLNSILDHDSSVTSLSVPSGQTPLIISGSQSGQILLFDYRANHYASSVIHAGGRMAVSGIGWLGPHHIVSCNRYHGRIEMRDIRQLNDSFTSIDLGDYQFSCLMTNGNDQMIIGSLTGDVLHFEVDFKCQLADRRSYTTHGREPVRSVALSSACHQKGIFAAGTDTLINYWRPIQSELSIK